MVLGCFLSNKLGSLVFIKENIKKDNYIAMLRENLLEYIDALQANDLRDIVFQQDNSRPHAAKATQSWLKNAREEYRFRIMK